MESTEIDISQKTEEQHVIENIQSNVMMSHCDKIKSYKKLYEMYDKDCKKVLHAVAISENNIRKYLIRGTLDDKNFEKALHAVTLSESNLDKYITCSILEDNVLQLLDSIGENKLSLDVAVELTNLPYHINKYDVIRYLQGLTSTQQINAIKGFILQKNDNIDALIDIKADILIKDNTLLGQSIPFIPTVPYVTDIHGKNIKIPESMYEEIIQLINDKTGTITYF